MGTLLVTGGSGFVGKSILDAFCRGRLRVHGIDRVVAMARRASVLREDAPELLVPGVELVDADVRMLTELHGADLVVHAAASADAARYRDAPAAEAETIVEGTRRVVELVSRATRPPLLIVLSSGAVYGRQPAGMDRLAESVRFGQVIDPPKRAYTLAKRTAEEIVAQGARRHALRASVARCFAFVGPWLPLDRHFAAGDFLRCALAREPIVVTARNPVVRSYLHADDLVEWLLRIAASGGRDCPVFNVGSDEPVSIRTLAGMIGRMAGVPVVLPPEDGGADPSDVDRYVPDISSARAVLGVSVTLPIEEAFFMTLDALRSRGMARSGIQPRG